MNNVVYDVDGNIIENPDLNLGYIDLAQRLVQHHDAVEATEAVVGWDILEGTENIEPGGLRKKVVVTPGTPAKEAYDEYETIRVYHPYTKEELQERNAPTDIERLEAQIMYTAMMTDTLIEEE